MGFLSKYSATEKLDLGDGFYVEVRRYLTSAQRAAAQKKLMNTQVVQQSKGSKSGEVTSKLDASEYRLELATQAIVDWNLTDERDMPLPLSPIAALRASVQKLPTFVMDQVIEVIDREGKTKEEAEQEAADAEEEDQQFPLGAAVGDQELDAGA